MIFADESVLETEYIPRRLFVRSIEMEELTQNIINAHSTLIYGPIGSGKTLLVKIIMRNLKESKIIPIYIDCTKILQEFFLIT